MDFLQPLRAEYLSGTDERLARLTGAIDRLTRAPADRPALTTLRTALHQLVGSAATFGLPAISETAAAAERECAAAEAGGVPDEAALARWQMAVDRIRALFDAARAGAAGDDWPVEREAAATAPRILSVEDDPDYAAYLRALLTEAGYLVQICSDPSRFEQDLAAFRPDLILLDIMLPGVSGYDLGRFLRQHDAHATLPVLFLTSEQQVDARVASVEAGGDDYLLKTDPPALILATVAARVERARILKNLVERDGLTQLLTHTAILSRVADVIAHYRRDPLRREALAMLDLDDFKTINDTHGHVVGDMVLASLAALLRARLRQSDIIGRYGGEEFTIVLRDSGEAEAVPLLTRILAEFAGVSHRGTGGAGFSVTFSAGVAVLSGHHRDARQWFAAADAALYVAKAAGRNRVVGAPAHVSGPQTRSSL